MGLLHISKSHQGATDVSYLLEAASHVTISNLTSCGGELSIHLQDFNNWGRPVVPPVQDCPEPVFDPDYFFGEPFDNNWVCVSKGMKRMVYCKYSREKERQMLTSF